MAGIIDMLTINPEERRKVVRMRAEIDAPTERRPGEAKNRPMAD
jgi:hypothetical protein